MTRTAFLILCFLVSIATAIGNVLVVTTDIGGGSGNVSENITVNRIDAATSAGLLIYSHSGAQVANLGAGGGQGVTFYDGVNTAGLINGVNISTRGNLSGSGTTGQVATYVTGSSTLGATTVPTCTGGQALTALGTCSSIGNVSLTTVAGQILWSPTVTTINASGVPLSRMLVTNKADVGGLNQWSNSPQNNPYINNFFNLWRIGGNNSNFTSWNADGSINTTLNRSAILWLSNFDEREQAPVSGRVPINGSWQVSFDLGQNSYNTGANQAIVGRWVVKHYYNAGSVAGNISTRRVFTGGNPVYTQAFVDCTHEYASYNPFYAGTVWCADVTTNVWDGGLTNITFTGSSTTQSQPVEIYFFARDIAISGQPTQADALSKIMYGPIYWTPQVRGFTSNLFGTGIKAIAIDNTVSWGGAISIMRTTSGVTYPFEINANNSGGVSAWFAGTVSADNFIDRSAVINDNVLTPEYFPLAEELLNADGSIKHEGSPCFAYLGERPDTTRPVVNKVTKYQEYTLDDGRTGYYPYVVEVIDYPYTIPDVGFNYSCQSALWRQGLAQVAQAMRINGTFVDMDTIAVENLYTKSKVPDFKEDYLNYFVIDSLNTKNNHYANINGNYLGMEERIVALEGAMSQLLQELCLKDPSNRYCTPQHKEDAKTRVSPFIQPTGAHNAYAIGSLVLWQNAIYKSTINANVWSPSAYPAGWSKQ